MVQSIGIWQAACKGEVWGISCVWGQRLFNYVTHGFNAMRTFVPNVGIYGRYSLQISCYMIIRFSKGLISMYTVYRVASFSWSPLQWRHNERDGVSNHQSHDCLLKRLFRRRSKKTSKLRVTGLCEGNSPVTGEFPAKRANNAEYVSIWWRHHAYGVRSGEFKAYDIFKKTSSRTNFIPGKLVDAFCHYQRYKTLCLEK